MNDKNRIIGIDLGTTNSVVAVVLGSEPEVIPNIEGGNKTPSIVAFLDNGEVVVGEIALRQAATNPHRTISSIKRLMGRSLDEIEESGEIFPYQLVSHDGEMLVDVDGMGYRPEQISALVLKKLKESAEAYLDGDVTQAVITVPAYFDDLQRQATIDAAEMAGLEVLRLINEPTAAAMAYGMGRGDDTEEIVAVYDFGGGTFDISILEISGKTFEVLTSTGDSRLGGDDLDLLLVRQITEEFREEHGVELTGDPVTLRRLKEVAERAKCELSTTRQTALSLPFIAYKDNQPLHLDRIMRREEFEDLIEDHVRRTIKCCRRALEEANLTKRDIGRVILVGGTTRIPLVQDSVEEFFDREAFRGVNPDEVVALGAATQAGIFEGNVQEVILLDVTPHSLGIEVEGGRFSRILDKNSTIPIKAAKTFTTTEENQQFVNIHVLQGESDDAADNRSLGKFALTDIPASAAGTPRIRVTFFINADGVVEISAEDMNTGSSEEMRIVHSQLTEEERTRRARRRSSARTGVGRTGARRRGTRVRGPEEEIAAASEKPFTQPRTLDNTRATPRPVAGNTPPPVSPQSPTPVATGGSREGSDSSGAGLAQPPQFAVLGDTRPGEIKHGVRARERDIGHHGGLEPVDYSKGPTMYSSSGAVEKPRDVTPPPPQAAAPAAPAAAPAATPKPAPPQTELPKQVADAIASAEKGADDPESQNAYTTALEMLAQPPLSEATDYTILRARVLLHSMAGQLEEARNALAGIRASKLKDNPEEGLALHDFVLERFGKPPRALRDRGVAKEQLGDIEGACADIEQALRQDPDSADRDYLEKLYRRRAEQTKDPAALFKLVKVLLKKNEVDDAIGVLQELQRFPDYEKRALKVLGLCHWQKNMHFLAWQSFRTLPVDDDLKDILYRLASDMEGADHLSNAVQVLEHLNEQSPGYRDVDARLRKINYRLKLQREDDASHRGVPVLSRDSRFTILEEINRGSMGIIYKAKDRTLNEIVALKVLNDYLCSDPSAVERFKSEARAAKKLAHPYIVRIHDLFEVDNKRFISMEYIEGVDLKTMIQERTQFGEEQIIYYFLQICDALTYAHKLGIVHRDIKPANIMITNENSVKITDFGIAKILRGDDMTNSGTAVIGTPLYMAPEQIIGERVDGRTDIYSLGIMFYEMVSGNPPFYLGNIEYHHIHTAPPPSPRRSANASAT